MHRLVFIFSFIFLISACGSADDFFEDIEEGIIVDSILVNPPNPNDSTKSIPADTIIVGNDTIISPKDTLTSDSLNHVNLPGIEYTQLFKLTSLSKQTTQGFAIFDKYLFNCHHTNDYIDVFDLETQESIASIKLEPETIVHCNNVNFGSEYFSSEDKFPLLYIQQRGYTSKLNVYRILCEGDDIKMAIKVQTISFESCSWCINAIDSKNNLLYAIYGYNGNNYISSFRLPSVKEGDVVINPKYAYKTYNCPYSKVGQDTAFNDNYLYILCGYNGEGQLWRIDMDYNKAIVIDLTKYGLKREPEGICFYKGNIILSFNDNNIFKAKIIE